MLFKAILAIITLLVLYLVVLPNDMDEIAIIISLGWVGVLSLWARMAQASEHRNERKREHAQLLEALGYEAPAPEEPDTLPWSPNMRPEVE